MAEQVVRKTRGLFDTSRGKRVFGEAKRLTCRLRKPTKYLFFFFRIWFFRGKKKVFWFLVVFAKLSDDV